MKIAIAGYGAEGEANYAYWSRDPRHDITIVDQKDSPGRPLPEGVTTLLQPNAFELLDDFDMVVRTAGLAPRKINTNGKIWSSTNEFFAKCPARIIGVTGSKGKGTTASLIASILRSSGKTVHLVGNIGVPSLDILPRILPEDIVVYELSSFQLWDIECSPTVAVVLMIEPDHLDVHADFEEYVWAKANIARFQTAGDLIIYNQNNPYTASIATNSVATKIPSPSPDTAHVKDGYFWYGEQKICSLSALRIPGRHNIDNACAAIDAAWLFTQDVSSIEAGLSAFDGLPHRLKFVRKVNDVMYFDDSIATTPGSAIAAIEAFEQPKIVILGGSSKGTDFTELASKIAAGNVRQVILIGDQADVIERAIRVEGGVETVNLGSVVTMQQIARQAKSVAQPGDIVILSPACASFGMFKNYSDRGEQFIAAVNSL